MAAEILYVLIVFLCGFFSVKADHEDDRIFFAILAIVIACFVAIDLVGRFL